MAIIVFAAGFRHLIHQARAEYEWAGTLVFDSALVWIAVTLVADGLEGGAVLDTLGAITGMFLAAAGYATFAPGVLSRWTGWVAYVGAGLCALCIPAMYVGPVDPSRFYNAGGWGPALIANFPPFVWFLVISVWMLRRREPVASLSSRAA